MRAQWLMHHRLMAGAAGARCVNGAPWTASKRPRLSGNWRPLLRSSPRVSHQIKRNNHDLQPAANICNSLEYVALLVCVFHFFCCIVGQFVLFIVCYFINSCNSRSRMLRYVAEISCIFSLSHFALATFSFYLYQLL